jgi:hypothetical protein
MPQLNKHLLKTVSEYVETFNAVTSVEAIFEPDSTEQGAFWTRFNIELTPAHNGGFSTTMSWYCITSDDLKKLAETINKIAYKVEEVEKAQTVLQGI